MKKFEALVTKSGLAFIKLEKHENFTKIYPNIEFPAYFLRTPEFDVIIAKNDFNEIAASVIFYVKNSSESFEYHKTFSTFDEALKFFDELDEITPQILEKSGFFTL